MVASRVARSGHPPRRTGRLAYLLVAALAWAVGPAAAAPKAPRVLVVIGSAQDAARLEAAAQGARIAAAEADPAALPTGVHVLVVAVPEDAGAARRALEAVRRHDPIGVVALVPSDEQALWWKASVRWKVPVVAVTGLPPDLVTQPGFWLHLGPTPEQEAIEAADRMLAPLAARRVAIVQEPTARGARLSAAFLRNLSPWIASAGIKVWPDAPSAADVEDLKTMEAGWFYVALAGARARSLVTALGSTTFRPRLLFADGARDASLLTAAADVLEGCAFLDGADVELAGRVGEGLIDALDRAGAPLEAVTARAFEGARRLVAARAGADSDKLKKVWETLAPTESTVTAFGPLAFAPHGAVPRWPLTFWHVQQGRYRIWPADRMPTEGCGPPLGFGRPPIARLGERGRFGAMGYGEGEKRTIELDLEQLGLSTGGAAPALDAFVREEILARAARIAHHLFRREADGTPVAGWSWGMSITIVDPGEDVPRGRVWPALVAGDDPGAGGRAFGSWVAVYSTFLRRTMYQRHALVPPLSPADAPLLDGAYRWGDDLTRNRRADEIRCLVDGFASAVGLTLAHEYGHCCGCDHDEEHPTSIMNVVAGAGAVWEDAVWIPRHQQRITQTLGIEGSDDEGRGR